MEDKYEFGKCKNCSKEAPLKNGYCIDCELNNKNKPDIFDDLFGGFK